MRSLIFFFIIISAFASSCVTERGARHYATDHPDKFADFCGTYYPVIAGPVPVYKPANNTDYSAKIDSLIGAGGNLAERLRWDSARAADSISKACAYLLASYAQQVDSVSASIKRLRDSYKPCKPDTVPTPYPVIDSGKLAAANQKISQLSQENQTLKAQSEGQKTADRRQNWYAFAFGLIAIPAAWGILKLIKVFI